MSPRSVWGSPHNDMRPELEGWLQMVGVGFTSLSLLGTLASNDQRKTAGDEGEVVPRYPGFSPLALRNGSLRTTAPGRWWGLQTFDK